MQGRSCNVCGTAIAIAILMAIFAAPNAGWSQAPETTVVQHQGIWGWDWMVASFTDYFNDGNDTGWTQINRRWHVSRGRYVLDGDYLPNAVGRGGMSVTHVGDSTWRDYMFQATFDTLNPSGLPSPDVHDAQFFFRVQSPPPDGTFYRLEVFAKGAGDPRGSGQILKNGLVQLWRFENGTPVTYAFAENSNSVIGTNQIYILVHEKTIRVCGSIAGLCFWRPTTKPWSTAGWALALLGSRRHGSITCRSSRQSEAPVG